jgi:hypothetical protein
MSYMELLDDYIENNKTLSVDIIDYNEEATVFEVCLNYKGVKIKQKAFIESYLLTEYFYLTKCQQATDSMRRQPALTDLMENIVFTVVGNVSNEERRKVMEGYIDDDKLFLDEATFFTARAIYKKLITSKGKNL